MSAIVEAIQAYNVRREKKKTAQELKDEENREKARRHALATLETMKDRLTEEALAAAVNENRLFVEVPIPQNITPPHSVLYMNQICWDYPVEVYVPNIIHDYLDNINKNSEFMIVTVEEKIWPSDGEPVKTHSLRLSVRQDIISDSNEP